MTRPRSEIISVQDTPYYHVVSRCVRRTFLCGIDRNTGKSFEHRQRWIEDRRRILSSIFAVDILSYSVLHNHYHMVVKFCPKEMQQWMDDEVLERWISPIQRASSGTATAEG